MPSDNSAISLTPLPVKLKEMFFESLKGIDSSILGTGLFEAALSLLKFPSAIDQKLKSLQVAYSVHRTNITVVPHLKQAIFDYIITEGYQEFQNILQKPFIEIDWNTSFIIFLAEHLNINLNEYPVVEAAIQEGKIYWRIINSSTKNILYDRQENNKGKPYNFKAAAACWQMTWEQFRIFKDSGKRSGTIAITQERFVTYFKEEFQSQATAVWKELKQKEILTPKNRLSLGWQVTRNQKNNFRFYRNPIYY